MTNAQPAQLRDGCEPACPACAHRHLTAGESETQKQVWLQRQLADWRERFEPLRCVSGEARWAYRDRVCLACEWHDGAWHIGMRRGEQVIGIPDCPVHSRRVRCSVNALRRALPTPEEFPLRYLVQNGAQLSLVLKTRALPGTSWLDDGLMQQLRACGVEGLWVHLHPAAGRKIFSKPGWHLLWGMPRSQDAQGFVYGPVSFRQPLAALYTHALGRAQAFLQPSPRTLLIDLYSGSGITLSRWSAADSAALGVELDGQACECASRNSPGTETLRGTCAQRLPQLDAWTSRARHKGKTRLLYVNPPRTGLEDAVREWIANRYRPTRIAYLSCSAGTLERDLTALCHTGYRVAHIIPYDFFPHTHHVETLSLLAS